MKQKLQMKNYLDSGTKYLNGRFFFLLTIFIYKILRLGLDKIN